MSRIVIFGATSAIAHESARIWATRGDTLCLVGRDAGKLEAVRADLQVRSGSGAAVVALQADLDLIDHHDRLIAQVIERIGGFDAALIAQGSLPDQERGQRDVAYALAQIHTNALSVVSLCTRLANHFDAQGAGCLAVISSVAGDRGRQSNYVYGAAKGMVSLFLQGLRNRLARRGIAVVDIRPGFVCTPMTAGWDRSGPLWAQAATVGYGIVSAMDRRRDIIYLPGIWRWIMLVVRTIPERVFKNMRM